MKKYTCICWRIFILQMSGESQIKNFRVALNNKTSFVSKILSASRRTIQRSPVLWMLWICDKPDNGNNHNESTWEENVKMCRTHFFSWREGFGINYVIMIQPNPLLSDTKEKKATGFGLVLLHLFLPLMLKLHLPGLEIRLQPHDNVVSCNCPAKSKSHSAHTSTKYISSWRNKSFIKLQWKLNVQ